MSHFEKGHRRQRQYRKGHDFEKQKHIVGAKGQEATNVLSDDSPVLAAFKQYAAELDTKHDKYEAIVKLGRDITIESKRIIFLLHSADRESKKQSVLQEAETRLRQLEVTQFKAIAKQLLGEDPYQFLRAYTAGLQEYIEALTFYYFIKINDLQCWNHVQRNLVFCSDKEAEETKGCKENEESKTEDSCNNKDSAGDSSNTSHDKQICLVPQTEYILGVADLTGELMRKCINNVGLGYIESCFQTCAFVKDIYTGFLRIGNMGPKECTRKLYTLRQSLTKMETACYTIHVRGSEIPKHMLADVFSGTQDDFIHEEDEGFY
ncbi:translin-associated protein X [Schistocerca americana]|uniref:translin-associated protein X n=1 Tax=Schistocerca americana TaxID=7009 RepID=UPI001F4FDD1D|nr:translin-associated protein X [Schistocerca americana]XP_047112100.1 translin-associated protein X [Schistocerca piceifrons]